jgi:hypothetical protein
MIIKSGVTIRPGVIVRGAVIYNIGDNNPANAAAPVATAWILMDGPYYNTPGNAGSGFSGGQSWRSMAPIGYFPYGKETYVYGDERIDWNGGVWTYTNVTHGLISTGTGGDRPWQATWNNGFTGVKVVQGYTKSTNYPSLL